MSHDFLHDVPEEVRTRAARVELVALDVDGTLTDGRLWYGGDSRETKVFHAHDGLGIKRLKAHGIEVAFITARISHAVAERAGDLDVAHLYQGQSDKRGCLMQLLDALSLEPAQTAFVGDDLPDLAPMRICGFAVAVANAHPWVAEQAHWQTRLAGGHGAVREVCDLILAARGLSDAERERYS